jgi:hypothetical protein
MDIVERLRHNAPISREHYIHRAADEIESLREKLKDAVGAIEKTLDENGHLADGDNCTLIDLKRALAKIRGDE